MILYSTFVPKDIVRWVDLIISKVGKQEQPGIHLSISDSRLILLTMISFSNP